MGFFESLNLFIPRVIGGGSVEKLDSDSESFKYFKSIGANTIQARDATEFSPTYWGNQPIVEAPAYIGIVVFFLFILSIFLVSNRNKYWLLSSIIISLLLSYGKNLSFLTDIFINFFPFYNKFRAVSSIQVILELCVPVLAVYSLHTIIHKNITTKVLKTALNKTLVVFVILVISLYLSIDLFDFRGVNDSLYVDAYGPGYLDALKLDRITLFKSDLFRTLIYVILSFIILSFYRKKIISSNLLIILFLIIGSYDLVGFNHNYVNSDDFVKSKNVEVPYKANKADVSILNDKSKFRVLDLTSNSTKASYFHNSVLGYHAAKLSNYDALLKFYISKNHMPVLNMLNVKYFISKNDNDEFEAYVNEDANGNAWFVENIYKVDSQNEAILSLDSLNLNKSVVSTKIRSQKFKILDNSTINLVEFKSNYLKYTASNNEDGYAVFSEIFYPHGWKVYVNGTETNFDNVNVALRGLYLNKGNNTIECYFSPDVVNKSSYVSLGSSLLLFLLMMSSLFYNIKNRS
jgi:hypothetical protein